VVQVTSLECGGCISASTSLSLSIEGVCSELVQVGWFRFNGEWPRVCTGDLYSYALGIALLNLSSGSLTAKAIETKARGNIGAYIEGKQDPIEWKQTPRSILDAENDNEELRSGLLHKGSCTSRLALRFPGKPYPKPNFRCTVSSVTCQVSRVTVR
jgi:hypothetical protein